MKSSLEANIRKKRIDVIIWIKGILLPVKSNKMNTSKQPDYRKKHELCSKQHTNRKPWKEY